jgi:hypothetical protein
LNPAVTYCVDGALGRPPAWFSVPHDAEVYVRDGYANQTMAWMELAPLPGTSPRAVPLLFSAPRAPVAVWVDGGRVKPAAAGRQWRIPARSNSFIAVLLREPPAGLAPVAADMALSRCVEDTTRRDYFKPEAFAGDVTQKDNLISLCQKQAGLRNKGAKHFQVHLPIKAPPTSGVLRIGPPAGQTLAGTWRINGKPTKPGAGGIEVRLTAGEPALLSFTSSAATTCVLEWMP